GTDEEGFLSAVLRTSRRDRPGIGFLEGHGERSFAGQLPEEMRNASTALDKRGYHPVLLDLLRGDSLDSIAVVVIASPHTPLGAAEADTLNAFPGRGGRMLVALDPASTVDLHEVLDRSGLRFVPEFLSDPDQRDPQLLYVGDWAAHPVVRALDER